MNLNFVEILLFATVITGLIWAADAWFWKPKRLHNNMGSEDKEPLLVEYSRSFFPVLLIVLILRAFLAEPYRIPSGSMKPTLYEGDFILVNKFVYGVRMPWFNNKIIKVGQPKRGDVVVFHGEDKDLIKRVIGLPGDHIEYKDNQLYINGEKVPNQLIRKTIDVESSGRWYNLLSEQLNSTEHAIYMPPYDPEDIPQYDYPYTDVVVPEDSYFVMGDNRLESGDSRVFGVVKDEQLMGRAVATWMSWDSNNWDVRWSRVGKWIK